MKRRTALKQMMVAAGGLASLPSWAHGWQMASLNTTQQLLTPSQLTLLGEVVETLIPATDTLGAKDLNLQAFVQKMLTDCYEENIQQSFLQGLTILEETAQQDFGKSFADCDSNQKMLLLVRMELSEEESSSAFYALLKELSILGYTTSEYFLTNFTEYNMMPGRYDGCVPVTTP